MPPTDLAGPAVVVVPVVVLMYFVGVWLVAVLDSGMGEVAAGRRPAREAAITPLRNGLRLLLGEHRATDAPDQVAHVVGALLLLTLTLASTVVIPLGPGTIVADLNVGIVYFSAFLMLTVAAVYLHGWGPNSKYPLMAAYRFVGVTLAYGSAFAITIISVALPAASLSVLDIVDAQATGLPNAVLQPVGFAIYLLLGMAISFWGPLNVVVTPGLAGGLEAEASGALTLVWRIGRYGLVLVVAAFAVPLFLAGWHGPLLPPLAWTVLKTVSVLFVLLAARWWLPTLRIETFMKLGWVVLLPLSLANVFYVGLMLLLFPVLGRVAT